MRGLFIHHKGIESLPDRGPALRPKTDFVGALAALLDLDFDILKNLVEDQFKGKEKLITPNIYALELGYLYAQEHCECPMGMRLAAGRTVAKHISDFDQILMDGNTAAAGCAS